MNELEPRLFGYIWRHSKRDQLLICSVVVASLPFYFASLDLPRRIVNDAIMGKAFAHGENTSSFLEFTIHRPAWLGGGVLHAFEGFQVSRLDLLLGLSGLFLLLVLINGAFKYWINLAKGALGERMLRRLRFQLFTLMLRFKPEALREIKPSETATIIKDEVEPIGSFIGDAIVVPAFLGAQATTALAFILMQNVVLGLAAASIVGLQVVIIPRLRRQLLKLNRERQLASRMFAGRIGEVLDGIEAVRINDSGRWEQAEIGARLYSLFNLRLQIYKRKFMVKYLNNMLAQITPFLFYAVGGVFALRGELDVGQLVAVLAAYRDLPPPLKELIDWDQQRLDVEVKYETIAAHFAPQRLRQADPEVEGAVPRLGSPLAAEALSLRSPHGGNAQSLGSFSLPLPSRIAVFSPGSEIPHLFARVLTGLHTPQSGTVRIGGHDLATLPRAVLSRRIAYAGAEPTLFAGTIRDNIVYGLRRRPADGVPVSGARERQLFEAMATGTEPDSLSGDWIDLAIPGVADLAELDRRIIDLLSQFGMKEDLYRFGLSAQSSFQTESDLAQRIIAARHSLRAHLVEHRLGDLVIPFDRRVYNVQASVAENLLFGLPRVPSLVGRRLASEPHLRAVLVRQGLLDDLVTMGINIAGNLIEIFRDLPVGHPLWRRFSIIAPDELPEFEERIGRVQQHRSLRHADTEAFLALALYYVEPRWRLGLLEPVIMGRVVKARHAVEEALNADGEEAIELYDPETINCRSSIMDNLLFGRINLTKVHAEAQVNRHIHAVIEEFGLESDVNLRGLDFRVGNKGQSLAAYQRIVIDLVRSLVRRPELLIVDGAIERLEGAGLHGTAQALFGFDPDMTVVAVVESEAQAQRFDRILRLDPGGSVAIEDRTGVARIEALPEREPRRASAAE
ncbi:ABC transporter ATP-binding protein [Methylobacterium planeticum]|uniref:ABC transporter ATP-binding protein n=1 Tax=Methylobacterium planeticum TaxID=2615211 RepID=A0A6N6MP97_9HYPH|nr:ABC transporter ATP-binding protein [Methylobacterium planeticum]KAB1070305.1 ABC transporter ATP-binding protein [Methylobacterium planeticum]